MSIIIRGVDMPKCCADCWALDDSGDYPMCRITMEQRGYTFRTREKRMDKCPLSPYTEWDVTCDPEYRESHFDTDEWGQWR